MRAVKLASLLFAAGLMASPAWATVQRYNIVCQLVAGCPDVNGVVQAQNTVMNRIFWDGVRAFTPPTGTTAVLEVSAVATSAPPPPTPAVVPTQQQVIDALKRQIPNNNREIWGYIIKKNSPSPTCTVPAIDSDPCYLGKLIQAMALLALNRTGDQAAAAVLIQSYLDTAPLAWGFKGLVDPSTQTVPPDQVETYYLADNFHFVASTLLWRLDLGYGPTGTIIPGVITQSMHDQLAAMFFNWGSTFCLAARVPSTTPPNGELKYYGSENLGAMNDATCVAAAYEWLNTASISGSLYPDGSTAAQSYALNVTRIKNWMSAYGGYGNLIEAFSNYNKYTLQAILAYYDLIPDATVQSLAKNVLDYWLSLWAIGQTDGNYGGARIRIYPIITGAVLDNFLDGMPWFWPGQWDSFPTSATTFGMVGFYATSYVPPDIFFDLALGKLSKGNYETLSGILGNLIVLTVNHTYHTAINAPLFYGYGYVTPDYNMGAIIAPLADTTLWSNDATQNWADSVVFGNGDNHNRVVLQGSVSGGNDAYQAMRAIASKGAMIVKAMSPPYSSGSTIFDVWIGDTMTITEQDAGGHTGWVFASCAQGYVAVKNLSGTYSWAANQKSAADMQVALGSILVVQAAGISDYPDLASFQAAVLALSPAYNGTTHVATFAGLSPASVLTMNDSSGVLTVAGVPFDFTQQVALQNPFASQSWAAQTAIFSKSGRTLNLNFAQ